MGIDIYAEWDGQTEVERKAQFTGFSISHGHVGYLREAYHGSPYATEVLVPEALEQNGEHVSIPTATLRERLPEAVEAARVRAHHIYNEDASEDHPMVKSLRAFVDLIERLEHEGKHPRTRASC